MIHDATQTLSDHHPTVTRISLNSQVHRELKRSSYLKMDVDELKVDSTRAEVERVWREEIQVG